MLIFIKHKHPNNPNMNTNRIESPSKLLLASRAPAGPTSCVAQNSRPKSHSRLIKLAGGILLSVFAFGGSLVQGATPYVMSSGNYLENFNDIANWGANFSGGVGAAPYASVGVNAAGSIPDGQKTTVATATWQSSGSSSTGIEKGTNNAGVANLVFLCSGTADNAAAIAVDLFLDFTGRNAGSLSFDYAEINNSFAAGNNRVSSLRVYTSTDGATFTELTPAIVSVTNGVASSGTRSAMTLPPSFTGSGTAVIRFYEYNGTGGTSGSRPKISIDNVAVTSTGNTVTPPSISGIAPTTITTNAGSTVAFTVTAGGDALSYYWYKQAGSISNLISGATTATLTLSNVLTVNATNYSVVVSNSAAMATSSVVTLIVIDPAINTQPVAAQTKFVNSTASFTVGAAGTPSLAYQWYEGSPNAGTPLSNGGRISGANTNTLTITSLAYTDTTNYFVVVANGVGSVTSSVSALIVTNINVVTKWDFNGSFNTTTPAPSYGSGTASLVGSVTGASAGGSSNDTANALSEGLANNGWQTTTYPTNNNIANNKTAGAGFNVSTIGYRNLKISYDSRNSNTGSKYMRLQYTTNGTDFTDYPAASVFSIPGSFESRLLDLTGFPGVRNNANFGFRVVSEYENTANYGVGATNYVAASGNYGVSGTIRYDIVTVVAEVITNANTPPTVSGFANATTTDTTPLNINFTVGDAETAAGSLTVSAVSENQSVIPDANLSFSGSGANRTLTVTPVAGSTGYSPILVTVSDTDGDSATALFNMTVTTSNVSVTPIPLNIQLVGTNVVLSWADNSFSLQSSTSVMGPYTRILTATSPYTNEASGSANFFRLIYP